ASIPAAGEACDALGLMARCEVDLGAQKLLRLPVRAQPKRMSKVNRNVRLLRCRKRVSMKADATADGQFYFHFVACEVGGIEAHMIQLVGAGRLDIAEFERSSNWHDQNIAVFALGAAQMKMGKAK